MSASAADIQSKIKIAQDLKAEGNEFVKLRDYQSAVKKYVKIFLYIRGLSPPQELAAGMIADNSSSSQKQEIKELEISANSNLALCFLKMGDYAKVVKFASDALKLDPENTKALFRRGSAHVALKHIDEARADLEAASVNAPEDAGIKKEMQKLVKLEKAHEAKERRAFAGMFDRAAREEDEGQEKRE